MKTVAALVPEGDILVRLAAAHGAMHKEVKLHEETVDKAVEEAWTKHAPFITEAKSVFLQIQAEAYRAGFSDSDMAKVLSH